ncbi:hypothetical protein [Formosa algae]|uniref:hypothetical protein n=1 Tax=Formosa algae TaxID=225843 RepID=UPI000CCF626C|nr:hypothetical protein [Formosa algae]PNW28030.1 hypothetical protein BKP44_10270 [Formosa algae]
MKVLAGNSIEVTLNIPIKNSFITYSKIYNLSNSNKENNNHNRGSIIEKSFALSIYPFIKSNDVKLDYTIGLADITPDRSNPLDLVLYTNNNKIDPKAQRNRSLSPLVTKQTVTNESFDSLAICLGNTQNYLIPLWKEYTVSGGDVYKFAIDFGTTNTHIEYAIEGKGSAMPFSISADEEQIAFLLPELTPRRAEEIRLVDEGETHLIQEILPKRIGEQELVKTPFRSCLLQNNNVDYDSSTFTFTDANIGFDYERKGIRNYLKSFTNLKWAKENNNEKQVKHYIEQLLMLCKNKVIMNNGDFAKTEIIWFFPVSMTTSHLNRFNRIWEDCFEDIFNLPEEQLKKLPESIAPFYFYKEEGNIRTSAKPSVSIDIGGGTTDVMIYFDDKPQLITSFKFAGNTLFGDGFNGNINSNGFVQKYKGEIEHILTQNNLKEELKILEKIVNEYKSSTDLINFFFSLQENKNVTDKHLDQTDFAKKLADNDDFKIIFLLFYSAIIYHIAELMKLKGIKQPRNIVFSGTGSKTLRILDSSKKLQTITPLFESIIDKVFKVDDSKLEIKVSKNPKEVTCKGGFYVGDEFEDIKHTKLIEINIGNLKHPTIQPKTSSENSICYKDLDANYYNGVVDNVDTFHTVFKSLIKSLDFKNEFGVSNKSIEAYNKLMHDDQVDYIMQGVKELMEDSTENEPIAQSLFFFPLVGLLYDLASEINES